MIIKKRKKKKFTSIEQDIFPVGFWWGYRRGKESCTSRLWHVSCLTSINLVGSTTLLLFSLPLYSLGPQFFFSFLFLILFYFLVVFISFSSPPTHSSTHSHPTNLFSFFLSLKKKNILFFFCSSYFFFTISLGPSILYCNRAHERTR